MSCLQTLFGQRLSLIPKAEKMVDTFAISVRLAGMLLLHNAQITLEEIEALPFVDSHEEAKAVAQRLLKAFARQYPIELAASPGQTDLRLRLTAEGRLEAARRLRTTRKERRAALQMKMPS